MPEGNVVEINNFRLCAYCLKRPSLGQTRVGWLGCIVCQREVDKAMQEFIEKKFRGKK